MMKTLFPKQQEAHDFFVACHHSGKNTLDSSDVGTGKTIVACAVAKTLGRPVAVICPKAVIPSWQRELAEAGITPLFVLNYEKLRTGRTRWLSKRGKKIMQWQLPEDTLVLVDETHRCLPYDALVATPSGPVEIRNLNRGDLVDTPLGPREVRNKWYSGYKNILSFTTEKGVIRSSHDHKFLTEEEGWLEARYLRKGHTLLMHPMWDHTERPVGEVQTLPPVLLGLSSPEGDKDLHCVWKGCCQEAEQVLHSSDQHHLQPTVPIKSSDFGYEAQEDERSYEESPAVKSRTIQEAVGGDANAQPNERSGGQKQGVQESSPNESVEWELSEDSDWRERNWTHQITTEIAGPTSSRVGSGVCRLGWPQKHGLAHHDCGSSPTESENRNRTGRGISQLSESKSAGRQKGETLGRAWMECSTYEERRRLPHPRNRILEIGRDGIDQCWDIEVEEAHCFYAGGVIVHNCKGPYTQNAQLLISLVNSKHRIHMMSATAAEDPTEMRAIGYALGLHALNSNNGLLHSWTNWMLRRGCRQNEWNAWELRRRSALADLHNELYGNNAKRLRVSDFPDSFRNNRVFIEPVQFSDASKIAKAYESLGITPAIVEQYIENGTVEDSEFVLVNILRARQLAESLKIGDIAEMASELVDGGNSVVIFVNFRESADALAHMLGCGKIVGGQSVDERQRVIDEFQRDQTHVLVVNIAAGGTGISLHDVNGERPRISLISPTFSVKDHLQALGRIHRNGAKSDALQKILVASGTVEEAVMKAIETKAENLHLLHDETHV